MLDTSRNPKRMRDVYDVPTTHLLQRAALHTATGKTTEPTKCVRGQRGKEHMLQGVASQTAIGDTFEQASYAHGRRDKETLVTVRCLAHDIRRTTEPSRCVRGQCCKENRTSNVPR